MIDLLLKAFVVLLGAALVLAVSALGLAWTGFWAAYGVQFAGGR